MKPADFWVNHLQLQPHPEGGFFREVYRSEEKIDAEALPARFSGSRNFSTSIYFLLPGNARSRLHRIQSDEMWHFYEGDALDLFIFRENGKLETLNLGREPETGQVLQTIAPKGCWFAAKCKNENGYSLMGCTVAPGFDFEDFELAETESLISIYPQHQQFIEAYT